MMSVTIVLASAIITNAADLSSALARSADGERFDIQGVLITPRDTDTFVLKDASGSVVLDYRDHSENIHVFNPGDIARARGRTYKNPIRTLAICQSLTFLCTTNPPQPILATIPQIKSGSLDNMILRIQGTVRDLFQDEIDPDYHFFILSQDGESIFVSMHTKGYHPDILNNLSDSKVEIIGHSNSWQGGSRNLIGKTISLLSPDSITTLSPAPSDPFSAATISTAHTITPEELAKMGKRRLFGRVAALWRERFFLIVDAAGNHHTIKSINSDMPSPGKWIEAVGFPETDLYHINLSTAKWRLSSHPEPNAPELSVSPLVTAREMLADDNGNLKIRPRYHGKTIRISGMIQSVPTPQNRNSTIELRCGDFTIPLDISACPMAATDLHEGFEIEATGVCIVETENWKSYSTFPHTTGILVAINSARDIQIISRPPWWNSKRLTAAIGTLLAVLVAILIWNLLLRRAVERRSRALEKEITARIGSDLKVYERTRLAVELHDSLAQNLSGVSLEIDAASDFAKENPDEMMRHLGIASSALKSCRDELRNCLWDLRNQSLEDEDMDTAIRRTLTPHLSGAKLSVRFNVPRTRLPDNVAHAILRIIRELTVNAVRHGHAKDVKVAGCIEDGHLLFSVRDNGCGFDPANHPGVEQGHYGLQGISERAEDLDGDMTIESEPGHGSKITIRIDATPNTKMTNEQ